MRFYSFKARIMRFTALESPSQILLVLNRYAALIFKRSLNLISKRFVFSHVLTFMFCITFFSFALYRLEYRTNEDGDLITCKPHIGLLKSAVSNECLFPGSTVPLQIKVEILQPTLRFEYVMMKLTLSTTSEGGEASL